MNETIATSIINEAANQEIITQKPQSNSSKIKLAEHLVKMAREAYSKGERGKHVLSIINIAKLNSEEIDEDEKFYKDVINEKMEKNLPIPPEIEGQAPNLPLDITNIGNKELRYMYGAFNACSARANWLYSLEEAGASAAKQIAEHYIEEYVIHADRKDYGGRSKAMAILKAEAKDKYPEIIKWLDREKKHEIKANKYKRLLDTYDNACERLSREWTFRMNEREHS